jgi:hypothetical protein
MDSTQTTLAADSLAAEHDELGAISSHGPRVPDAGDGQAAALEAPTLAPAVLGEPVPHPLAEIDDDVTADLAAMGITLTPDVERSLDDPHRQAMAALLLRRMQQNQAKRDALIAAKELTMLGIEAHYDRQAAPLDAEYLRLERFVETLAEITAWGKKRSASTPFGSYGIRTRSATVECPDPAATLAYAVAAAPEFVRVAASLPLPQARESFSESELAGMKQSLEWGKFKPTLDVDGTLPPGVVAIPARREPFVTPAPLAGEG